MTAFQGRTPAPARTACRAKSSGTVADGATPTTTTQTGRGAKLTRRKVARHSGSCEPWDATGPNTVPQLPRNLLRRARGPPPCRSPHHVISCHPHQFIPQPPPLPSAHDDSLACWAIQRTPDWNEEMALQSTQMQHQPSIQCMFACLWFGRGSTQTAASHRIPGWRAAQSARSAACTWKSACRSSTRLMQ